jgi:hypothetical protein
MGQVRPVILPCLALQTMFCKRATMMTKERAGRIGAVKTLPALGMTLHCHWPGRIRTLPSTKSSKGDVGSAAYWNTNVTCTMSLRHMLYSPTINIKPIFLAENEKKSKKNLEETYNVVL